MQKKNKNIFFWKNQPLSLSCLFIKKKNNNFKQKPININIKLKQQNYIFYQTKNHSKI